MELSLQPHAIILSLPCSSFELIPLNVTTTQEHWGSDKVISRITHGGEYGQNTICLCAAVDRMCGFWMLSSFI